MELTGRSIIGYGRGQEGGAPAYGHNPTTGERMEPGYHAARPEEVDQAAQLAHTAFASYSRLSGREKGAFLQAIAYPPTSVADGIITDATIGLYLGWVCVATAANVTASINKVGSGTLVLQGNNAFTGTLTISGGTVRVESALGRGATFILEFPAKSLMKPGP